MSDRKPVLRHIANLWTLMGHPAKSREWSLDKKLRAIKEAGFDGVCWAGSAELRDGCKKNGLIFVGGMASGNVKDFPRLLREQKDCGAVHVNVQLAHDEMLMPEALKLALALNREGKKLASCRRSKHIAALARRRRKNFTRWPMRFKKRPANYCRFHVTFRILPS
jgi:hypothetical protein